MKLLDRPDSGKLAVPEGENTRTLTVPMRGAMERYKKTKLTILTTLQWPHRKKEKV